MCYIVPSRQHIETETIGQATFTFRVDQALKDDFATIAKSMDRTGAQLLRDYMRNIVHRQEVAQEYDTWFREQVQAGLASANAGNLILNEAAEEQFAARRTDTRRRLDKSV